MVRALPVRACAGVRRVTLSPDDWRSGLSAVRITRAVPPLSRPFGPLRSRGGLRRVPQLERATPDLFRERSRSVVRRAAEALRLRLPALALEPPLPRGRARLRRAARARWTWVAVAQLLEDPLGRELAVAELRALVLRDGANDRAEPLEHAPRLGRGQRPASPRRRRAPRPGSSSCCACWPPGPLERENRKATSDRIDSLSMAAILLDVDGVLHVSGAPIPGAVDAVQHLRAAGHRIRFVTNSTHDVPQRSSATSCGRSGSRSRTTSCRRPAASPRACSRASACSR